MKTKLLLPTLALASSIFFNSCAIQKKELHKNLNIESNESEKENKKISEIFDIAMKEKKSTTINLLEQ
jgi:hypothetical protein